MADNTNLEKEVKSYIINKEHGKGIDWFRLKSLKERSIQEGTEEFHTIFKAVLSKAKQRRILCSPQPNTFYCLVDETNPHLSINGERYNIKAKEELKDYINAFLRDRWVSPVMQIGF